MKVLIADDEPDVRIGLKKIIDWSSLGFEVCGEAENGEVCLREILRLLPDLVLLDIRMPKMHGLECAQEARRKGWNGRIIVLSGYSDFKYAQSAIECGVETYLLKPIDEDELTDSVKKIGDKIKKEHSESRQMSFVLEKARRAVLADFLSGKTTPENASSLKLNADGYLVVIPEKIKPGCADSYIELELGKLLKTQDVESAKLEGTDVFLLKGNRVIERFDRFASSTQANDVFLAVGRHATSPEEIPLSYRDAWAIFARRFFLPKGCTVVRKTTTEQLRPCDIGEMDLRGYEETMFTYLQAGNFKSLCEMLDGLFGRLSALDIQPDYTVTMFISICVQVKNRILEAYGDSNPHFGSDAELITTISGKRRLFEIIDFMKKYAGNVIEILSGLQSSRLADRIRVYMEKNYAGNINLEGLAEIFGYNSAYLGKVFKNSVGESFHSYLDRIRIGRAKKLLADDGLKVYEVSRKVGYENIDYFYIKFHKYEGRSPLEYRKSLRGGPVK